MEDNNLQIKINEIVSYFNSIGLHLDVDDRGMIPIRESLRESWYVDELVDELGYEKCVHMGCEEGGFIALLDDGRIFTANNSMIGTIFETIVYDSIYSELDFNDSDVLSDIFTTVFNKPFFSRGRDGGEEEALFIFTLEDLKNLNKMVFEPRKKKDDVHKSRVIRINESKLINLIEKSVYDILRKR